MPNIDNFSPVETKTASGSTTSASVSFTANTGVNANMVMVTNESATTAYVRWGNGAQTAVNTDTPILPNGQKVFNKGLADTAAVVLKTGSGSVYFTAGNGN